MVHTDLQHSVNQLQPLHTRQFGEHLGAQKERGRRGGRMGGRIGEEGQERRGDGRVERMGAEGRGEEGEGRRGGNHSVLLYLSFSVHVRMHNYCCCGNWLP